MNNHLGPTYQNLFGKDWVLWYSTSNNYSIVGTDFKSLLDLYLKSSDTGEFTKSLSLIDEDSNPISISKSLEAYLKQCNTAQNFVKKPNKPLLFDKRNITCHYTIFEKHFTIHYDSELVKKSIHPSIAHFEISKELQSDIIFDIHLRNKELYLFKNGTLLIKVPKQDYHKVQGKFIFHIINFIHNANEEDWLGAFHGSTVADGHNAILFIGKSGSGKSTLSSILAANDYELVADDVSPISAKDNYIYQNPTAISIKSGAFKTLSPLVPSFNDLPTTIFNRTKGKLKYLPFPESSQAKYPCKTIILVKYTSDALIKLEPVSTKTILEILIPESWLSPKQEHAKQFLDWLDKVSCYQLTYSNTDEVIQTLGSVFNNLQKQ